MELVNNITIDIIDHANHNLHQNKEHIKIFRSKIEKRDEGTALIHLHRAEVARSSMYRVRLDNTTNLAFTTTGVLITFVTSNSTIPHYYFIILFLLVSFFLLIETRRYIIFDISKHRARSLEQYILNQIFVNDSDKHDQNTLFHINQLDIEKEIYKNYLNVTPLIPYSRALFTRLKRIYIYLYIILYVAWIIKMLLLNTFNLIIFLLITIILIILLFILFIFIINNKKKETDV